MKIFYTSKFLRAYKKLSVEIKDKLDQKERIAVKDIFDKSLKTHKLSGKFANLWAFSVDYQTRVIFEFQGQDEIFFHEIGGHELY